MNEEAVQQEQVRLMVRAKMEEGIRLMQRALNHERLGHADLETLADCCNWVWQWAANVEDD